MMFVMLGSASKTAPEGHLHPVLCSCLVKSSQLHIEHLKSSFLNMGIYIPPSILCTGCWFH